MPLRAWINRHLFQQIHGNTLVFNDCREDPRIDHVALRLSPADVMLVVTSAGCNSLDYALSEVRQVYAVDMNPRQNALLELKQAGIRALEFDDFFRLFGTGRHEQAKQLYQQQLREQLTPEARRFWDRKISLFAGRKPGRSFYFSGPCGRFAKVMNLYIDHVTRLRPQVDAMFAADDLPQQRTIYEQQVRDRFWSGPVRWLINRDATLALLGVPLAQRRQIDRDYPGGVANFVQTAFDAVFTQIRLRDNYLWHIYLYGCYTPECCPRYLQQECFERLKQGLVDRISVHTMTVADLLEEDGLPISRFVLLDHMDWLSSQDNPELRREWQGILRRATGDARVLWRSGGMRTDFVDQVQVNYQGRSRPLVELLRYNRTLAAELHAQDRVHTYGSFYIADLNGA